MFHVSNENISLFYLHGGLERRRGGQSLFRVRLRSSWSVTVGA